MSETMLNRALNALCLVVVLIVAGCQGGSVVELNSIHYGFDFCPGFWDWLEAENKRARVFSVEKVGTELEAGADDLATWAGVRGGISVALALSMPPGPARQVFLPMTYVIVLFSILVQGLSLGALVRRTTGAAPGEPAASD